MVKGVRVTLLSLPFFLSSCLREADLSLNPYYDQLFNQQLPVATFNPAPGAYNRAQNVTISTTTPQATICYRTDGIDPTAPTPGSCGANSLTYKGAIKDRSLCQPNDRIPRLGN